MAARLVSLILLSLILLACGSGDGGAETARQAGGLRLVRVGTFDRPLLATAPRGDRRRLMVVQQGGVIRTVRDGRTLAAPFLDLRTRVVAGGEQGLLGLAFAPDYARSGAQAVWEFRRRTLDRADPASGRLVLRMADSEGNHNGGNLAFGPDRLLYIGTGDGGGGGDRHGARGNAQSLSSLLGKILRIDPRASGGRAYRVPASNPFTGRPGARGEIYAYGLRNPWRFSFDRRTGDLAIADVGQDAVEELDFAHRGRARGANFGWGVWEGRSRYTAGETAPGAVAPVLTKRHADGWCSITGGHVLRDPGLPASLRGRYVYGDFCRGHLRTVVLRSGRARGDRPLALPRVASLASFGEDARGRVYVVSVDGPVYRLARG
ncbi:unannotated protein [freshwater metagenome]|uniref:Unannotated protein n=1 Tax=freshwater metagenome TaxID=449393 RepID=A0A6J7I8B7_9ZZZZ|nr:glucose dehydrogenase [Actinomycetota bacterium]